MYLDVKNVSFSYDNNRRVLDCISFSVNKGETLAVVGASGSGKSTLLRLIAGILPNRSNNNLVGSITIENKSPIEFLKEGKSAFMFQEPTLFPNLNVRKNIEVPLRIKNTFDRNKVNKLINVVGLDRFENYLPKNLSGGMKTRVSLARSFATDPEFLLLDEPFSSLDIGWKQNLYDELQEIRKNTMVTVIMVTHDIQEAIYLANTIIVLGRNGGIINVQAVSGQVSKLSDVPIKYKSELSEIQNLITIDSQRNNLEYGSLEEMLYKLEIYTGKEDIDFDNYNRLRIPLREFIDNKLVNEKLIDLYKKANLKQRFSLVWDIFQQPQDKNFTTKVFMEIYNNLETFNENSISFYRSNPEMILSVIKNRLYGSNEKSPASKKWLYLCQLLISSEIEEVESILIDATEEKISNLEYPFASTVAEKLLAKLSEK